MQSISAKSMSSIRTLSYHTKLMPLMKTSDTDSISRLRWRKFVVINTKSMMRLLDLCNDDAVVDDCLFGSRKFWRSFARVATSSTQFSCSAVRGELHDLAARAEQRHREQELSTKSEDAHREANADDSHNHARMDGFAPVQRTAEHAAT